MLTFAEEEDGNSCMQMFALKPTSKICFLVFVLFGCVFLFVWGFFFEDFFFLCVCRKIYYLWRKISAGCILQKFLVAQDMVTLSCAMAQMNTATPAQSSLKY